MPKYNVIALVDCNNFFASCEILFNPELKGKPVCVLSNNDGCIVARSNEAKALGIKMGMPYFMAKKQFKAESKKLLDLMINSISKVIMSLIILSISVSMMIFFIYGKVRYV